MVVSAQRFRKVMGAFATGVTVVTTIDQAGNPYGLTVNSFTSVSIDPLLILVCLDNRLSGLQAFLEAGKFGVNILSSEQQEISNHFASSGTERSSWIADSGRSGVPMLEHSLASLECQLTEKFVVGDHTILIGEVLEVHGPVDKSQPLLYYRGRYRRLAAPTRGTA